MYTYNTCELLEASMKFLDCLKYPTFKTLLYNSDVSLSSHWHKPSMIKKVIMQNYD